MGPGYCAPVKAPALLQLPTSPLYALFLAEVPPPWLMRVAVGLKMAVDRPDSTTAARYLSLLLTPSQVVKILDEARPNSLRELLRALLGRLSTILLERESWRGALEAARALPPVFDLAIGSTATPVCCGSVLIGSTQARAETTPVSVALLVARGITAQVAVSRVLQAVAAGRVEFTLKKALSAASVTGLTGVVSADEQRLDPARQVAFIELVLRSPLVDATKKVCTLTDAGRASLKRPPIDALRRIFLEMRARPPESQFFSTALFGGDGFRHEMAVRRAEDPSIARETLYAGLRLLRPGQWIEAPMLISSLARVGLLPCISLELSNISFDAGRRAVNSSLLDGDLSEGFRLRLPFVLQSLFGPLSLLGLVDLAVGPEGLSPFRFASPRPGLTLCREPYSRLTHVRLTELGHELLDPFAAVERVKDGPGDEGLDALAALLGRG